jgi:hypothetical protein
MEDGTARPRVQSRGRVRAEIREIHDVSDDRGRPRNLAARVARRIGPAHGTRARIEGVKGAVVGAQEHRRPQPRDVRHSRGRVHVRAGARRPRQLPRTRGKRVHAMVGVADVHPPKGDSGS